MECRKFVNPHYYKSEHRLKEQVDFWQHFLAVLAVVVVAHQEVDEHEKLASHILGEFKG